MEIFNKKLKTYHAPPQRSTQEEIIREKEWIEKSDFVLRMLAEVPLIFFILNINRQVIFSNIILLKQLGYHSIDEVLGFRPGELFKCINASKNEAGCGTSRDCQVCGAVNAVLESDKLNTLVVKEARLTTVAGDINISHDYEVASKPFEWEGKRFFMVTLRNIDDLKKRERLEKTFFHDILNRTGILKGLTELLNTSKNDGKKNLLIEVLTREVAETVDDIIYQQRLMEAERGALQVDIDKINSFEVLENIKSEFVEFEEKKNKVIVIDYSSIEMEFTTDKVLLRRILGNMVRNALEAIEDGENIWIGASSTDKNIKFWVQNPGVIPQDIQSQIFQRSFSTKGKGRGIGTYSVKLFTEQYLNGKVEFISNKDEGTIFTISLPFSNH